MTVYLLHFDTAHPNGKNPRHYLGYASNLDARIRYHKSGQGAAFTNEMHRRGIPFQVVRIWPGKDRAFERKIHNLNRLSRLCPVCNPGYAGIYQLSSIIPDVMPEGARSMPNNGPLPQGTNTQGTNTQGTNTQGTNTQGTGGAPGEPEYTGIPDQNTPITTGPGPGASGMVAHGPQGGGWGNT